MIESLIPKSAFTGLDGNAHLATGGESPMLRSHLDVLQQFMRDKSQGEPARELQAAVTVSYTHLTLPTIYSV